MTKAFETDYETYETIEKAFNAAETEEQKDEARKAYQTWADSIEARGRDYADTFRLYMESRENGNDLIDIHDIVRNAERMIKNFRAFGIEAFTFTSTWSSAIETAWEFTKLGCRADGMVEVFSEHTKIFSDEHEKRHGFLFRVG